jgi:hypothetical protein
MSMIKRFQILALQVLISIDQSAQTIICGAIYLFLGGNCPSADETISSIVGRRAEDGKWWAKILAKVINSLFSVLGQKDHCRASIEILSTKKYTD